MDDLDAERSKKLIITQVLNYGDEQAVNWVNDNYSWSIIRDVVVHPTRGVWWREKLHKWLNYFDELVDPVQYEAAIIEMNNLRPKLWKAYWQRIEEGQKL